jgi:ATP-dependent DNA ligase
LCLEGIIAKRLDSEYQPARGGDDWLKLPLKPAQHFVIGAHRLDGKRLDILLVGQVVSGVSSQFFHKRR